MVAQEIHFLDDKGTFVVSKNKAILLQAVEEDVEVPEEFFPGGRKDGDTVHVTYTKREVPQNAIHEMLEGGTCISEAKAGII